MTAAVYDSFTLWLQTAPYDIVFLQEIHRGFGAESSEWQAGSWIYISSPDNKSRFAGVAVAVRTSLAHKYTVRSLPVIPGRILHVRLSGHNYSIDVFSCYQHVINSRETQAANASKRDLFWSTLGKYLASLPFRNVLILAGDFNCAARREDGIAGPAAPPSNPYYFDQDDFMGLMAAGSLCLLNTWSCSRHNDMNTFINGAMRSQIDYVATRVTSADAQARLSRPVLNLDFAPWRLGCKHRPVQATIRLKPGWLVASTRRPPTIGYDKTGLESALRAQGPSAALFHQEVQSAVQRLEHPTAASLNQMLLHVCERSFPLRPKTVRLRPWQQADVQASVREMWRLRADLRRVGRDVRLGLYSLRQAFRAFQAHWRFQKCYKEVRKRGLWHRRQALHDHLAQARAAEMNRDVRTIYQEHAEISDYFRALLTPAQEHAEISDYFRTLFSQIEHSVQPAPRLIPVTLEVSEIQASLGRLGSGRAVPHGHAPTSAWRYCRQVLSGPLTEAFHSETIAGYPLHWADCHLALVPKPGKVIKRPESLRPLGIQDAAGKTISRVIKERLFLQIRELLESYPQFAYLRRRSTADAIRRVSEHCSKIRSRVAMDRHNVYSKKAGKRRQPYVGGAQLTLDMSTAFDRLPRRYMQEALEWAQVDASLASLILDTHCSCRYHIRHEGFESTVEMENGVRQGCTLAPLIWALYSVFLIHQLELRLHSTWPREALTLYADDTHCAWELNSLADLKFFIRSAVLLLSAYQTFGMKINPVKSALMIRLVGTHGSKWVQRHTLCIDNKPLFLFSHDLQTYHIPIVKQAKYLGVIISYQGYERMRRYTHFKKQFDLSVVLFIWYARAPAESALHRLLAALSTNVPCCSICAISGRPAYVRSASKAYCIFGMTSSPLQDVQSMFQHMDVETELFKRTQAEGDEQTAGSDSKPSKYPRPAMKGSAGSGKGGTVPHQSEAPPTETEDPLAATAAALAPRTATGSQDWKANAGTKDKEAETGQQPRGNRQQGWQNSSGPRGRRGWGSQNWGGQGQRRSDKAYDQALEENVKLLARLCLRHEDELSQMRVERDFVITMETQEAAVLSKLYRLSTVWKEKKEKGEVDCSLRLALFLGLCQVWLERLRALEADTAEAKALRERIMELGQAFIPEGQTELHWWYMKWDPTTSTLMKLADVEPLKQSQIVNSLVELSR
eukprot:s140_g13.t2